MRVEPDPEPTLTDREEKQAAWGFRTQSESRWPARIAVLVAIALYITLPQRLTYGPRWVVPALEGALLIPLALMSPHRQDLNSKIQRVLALGLIVVINAANVISLGLLVRLLLEGGKASGKDLIFSAIQIWLTNVIVFALWYWELDRGGPEARAQPHHRQPDFLFPQMVTPDAAPKGWCPSFFDYVYVSATNSTAFSPTDTMPLTQWAKMLMLVQSLASLLTVALVAARAVNILS
jgi:uncharacterized membrane protein